MVTALALTACGDDGGGAEEASRSGSGQSTSTPAPASASTTSAGAASTPGPAPSTTTRSPAATTSPGAPAPTTATAAPAPAGATALTPPAPGTYRYDTTGSAAYPILAMPAVPLPAVTTLVVDPPTGNLQHATRDLRDINRNGPILEPTFEYRPDGVYLVSLKLTITLALFSDVQDLRPATPVLLYPTGARPGYHREMDLPGQLVTAHFALDVLREEQVTIDGQPVGTSVVRMVATLPAQLDARWELTVWLSPPDRLWVKEQSVTEAKTPNGGPVQYRNEYQATLQRLTPN